MESDLLSTLSHLRNLPAETEIVEFKEAKMTYDFGKLGKYFSAIANCKLPLKLGHRQLEFSVCFSNILSTKRLPSIFGRFSFAVCG